MAPKKRGVAAKGASGSKGKAAASKRKVAKEPSAVEDAPAVVEQQEEDDEAVTTTATDEVDTAPAAAGASTSAAAEQTQKSMEDRMAKMRELRKRMNDSARLNRQDLIQDTNTQKQSARDLARLERKRKQAEMLGEKLDAQETGEDLERKRAWEYSIEDNEKWDKKQARKESRADHGFTDYDDVTRRKYKKDIDALKPDIAAYNRQKAAAQGSTSDALAASEDLYRDANSLAYADHKPTDDAIDRVIGKINMDIDKRHKFSRKRQEVEGDVTYINEKNKHFNKKLERYYNQYTEEIRASFERGTAL